MAVAVGFEPTVGLTPHIISSDAPSAARTRHRRRDYRKQPARPKSRQVITAWVWVVREISRPSRSRTSVCTTIRSEEHTSELQSLMRISYAVFCLKKKKNTNTQQTKKQQHKAKQSITKAPTTK